MKLDFALNNKYLTRIQYALSLVITALMLFSLIPQTYTKLSFYILVIIIAQLILSIIRYRFINSFLELVILLLALLGLIPFLGWFFRLISIPIVLLDLLANENSQTFQSIEIFTKSRVNQKNPFIKKNKSNNSTSKKQKSKKDKPSNFQDAEFKEKKK